MARGSHLSAELICASGELRLDFLRRICTRVGPVGIMSKTGPWSNSPERNVIALNIYEGWEFLSNFEKNLETQRQVDIWLFSVQWIRGFRVTREADVKRKGASGDLTATHVSLSVAFDEPPGPPQGSTRAKIYRPNASHVAYLVEGALQASENPEQPPHKRSFGANCVLIGRNDER